MLLARFKISGHSMEPNLLNGETVLISSVPFLFQEPKVGDIVLFHYNCKKVIKRIKKINTNSLIVEGDNISDTLKIKPLKSEQILGKYLFKI